MNQQSSDLAVEVALELIKEFKNTPDLIGYDTSVSIDGPITVRFKYSNYTVVYKIQNDGRVDQFVYDLSGRLVNKKKITLNKFTFWWWIVIITFGFTLTTAFAFGQIPPPITVWHYIIALSGGFVNFLICIDIYLTERKHDVGR